MERTPRSHSTTRKLSYPVVMGILNVTADSFSGDGITEEALIQERASELLRSGVSCIDIGAESTRPGAIRVEEETEKRRIQHAVRIIRGISKDVYVSVDTTRASVAESAIKEGADIINDISGGTFDPQMFRVIAESESVLYVVGHVKGSFVSMHEKHETQDIVEDVLSFWQQKISQLSALGVVSSRIICDPGIGFSKCLPENSKLIKNASRLVKSIGVPVLFGVSRKRFIKTLSGTDDNDSLDRCSLFLHSSLLRDGVSIIRTHEVPHTINALKVFTTIYA